MLQAWWCEGCEVRGYVEYHKHSDVMSVYNDILTDHRQRSPECESGGVLIRVQNEAWVTACHGD